MSNCPISLNKLTVKDCITTPCIGNNPNICGTTFGENPLKITDNLIQGQNNTQLSLLTNNNLDIGIWDTPTLPLTLPSLINNCLYIGNNTPFNGFNYEISGILNGDLLWEYWNGSSWQKICIMASDKTQKFANTPFERLGDETLRLEDVRQNWYIKELNGINKFWIRICNVNSLSIPPIINSIDLFTSFKETINGVNIYYGLAELKRELVFHRKLLDGVNSQSPDLRDLLLTPTFSIDSNLNSFVHVDEESIGGTFRLPRNVDTSSKLIVCLAWYPFTTVSNIRVGYIQWNIETVPLKANDTIDGSLASTIVSKRVLVDKPNNANYLYLTEIEIDIETLLPNELLGIRIFRDEPNSGIIDLFESNINLVDVSGVVKIIK